MSSTAANLKTHWRTPVLLPSESPSARPNLNAFVERWVPWIQQETLDHIIVFGEKHFDYLISGYVDYYHNERPHQSLENKSLVGHWLEPDNEKPSDGEIVCRSRLGGWLKSYERKAA